MKEQITHCHCNTTYRFFASLRMTKSWCLYCHPERSEGSPYSVWGIGSGKKRVKKRPGHYMKKWKSRQHTAIVTLLTDSSLRSEWQDKDISVSIRMIVFGLLLQILRFAQNDKIKMSRLRSEWQNNDISVSLDMTSVNWYITSFTFQS